MYSLKDELEEMFHGSLNPKTVAKKKLNEYDERYGENRWDIENQIPDDEYIAKLVLYSCINGGPKMNNFFLTHLNDLTGNHFYLKKDKEGKYDYQIPAKAADAVAVLTPEQIKTLNNLICEDRMRYHFNDISQNPDQIVNLKGWYDRIKQQYYGAEKFEQLFEKSKEEYLSKHENKN